MLHTANLLRRALRTLAAGLVCAAVLSASAASSDGWINAIDAAKGGEKQAPHVMVDLVSAKTALTPQAVNQLAVRFTHEEGWHTYWRMPGDAGLPPEFTFTLPGDLKATDPLFPLPARTITSGLTSFGYGGTALFPFRIEVPRGVYGNATIRLHVEYLACREMCVPESADVSLRLPIDVAGKDTPEAADIAGALSRVPETVADAGTVTASIEANRIMISVAGNAAVQKSLDFFPLDKNVVKLSDPPEFAPGENGAQRLWLTAMDKFAAKPAEVISGVLVADGGPQSGGWAVETKIPLKAEAVPLPPANVRTISAGDAQGAAPQNTGASLSFTAWSALLSAFLGGLILNLMPCVFPVLSLKLLDLVKGAKSSTNLMGHGVAFTGGVLATMLALSGLLLALRGAGHALGWGFQLQSAWVVSALILLFTAITFNLLGFYEFTFGSRIADAGSVRKAPKTGLAASFLTGVLAVIVASPCTAPFMGAALGYALTQPAIEALLIFLALGFGMAAPWLVLCLFPSWARRLPKPGPWMNTFRRIMAIPMALAVLWLCWVLSHQTDYRGVLLILCGMGALGIFCWLLGRRQWGRTSSTPIVWIMLVIAVASAAIAGSSLFERTAVESRADYGWAPWSEKAVEAALAEGHPVFVDFTAAWCITCQANKLAALDRAEVLDRMNALGYVKLEGDWTNRNAEIAAVLSKFGRSGVPLYLIYRPNGEVKVLPELLTPGIVLEAIEGK